MKDYNVTLPIVAKAYVKVRAKNEKRGNRNSF